MGLTMLRIKSMVCFFVEGIGSLILSLVIPRYLKKVIFIASVYIILLELSPEDKAAFKKINDKMKLVNKSDLLMLPKTLVDSIWGATDVKKFFQDAVLVKQHKLDPHIEDSEIIIDAISEDYKPAIYLATKLVEKTPSWLRYAKPAVQISDIIVPAHDSLYVTT